MPEGERPQTVAVATMDDPFAQGTAYGLRDKLADAGLEIVVDEVYPPNTTDFSSIAAKIADSDADMVIGGTQYQDAVNLIVALQQLGYQPDLAAYSTAPTNPEFSTAIGAKTEGILSPTGYTETATWPSNVDFVERYTKLHGNPPGEDEANAYTTGQVVAAAVEAAGCAEQGDCQQELIEWLRTNEVETVVGPLTWDETGKPQGAHLIQQYVDGEIQIVLPQEAKEADFVYPKPPGDLLVTSTLLFQSLVLGVLLGGLYALLAAGLTLYFGVMRVVMIAHSAFLILAAYLAWFFNQKTGMDPLLSLVITVPLFFAVGVGMQRLLITRLRPATLTMMSVLLTFAVALFIEGMIGFVWSGTQRRVQLPYSGRASSSSGHASPSSSSSRSRSPPSPSPSCTSS
ncbi:ABC transporter substrate-binding protein [Oerskovia sp. M15]